MELSYARQTSIVGTVGIAGPQGRLHDFGKGGIGREEAPN